ncbi:MAG: hypothetical protein GX592_14950 [Clostridiales bacterium]|nr:hypothetical protein [Clostridiales bacterium]
MKRNFLPILFWGAVWGICEASIGYILHLASVALPGLPGALMFPIGFFCMYRGYKSTGKAIAPSYIAAISAAIKLVDFLLPGHVVIRVVNPALSILMEGLAVSGVYALFRSPGRAADYARVLVMGVLWRALFALYLFVISLYGLPAALVTSGASTLLRFVLLESFINSLIIYAGLALAPKLAFHKRWKIGPVAATTALFTAIGLQVIL